MNATENNTVTETTATDTTVATTPATVATPAAVVPAVPKAPSKKSQADAIFAVKLIERSEGLFASNKEFRAAVLKQIMDELGVTIASAATMYNAAKKDAETADATVALGRDPKKEKPAKVEGAKRGRPAGSKNKVVEVTTPADGAEAAATEGDGLGAEAATETVVAAEAAPVADAVA